MSVLTTVKSAWFQALWSFETVVALAYFVLAVSAGNLTPQHERAAPVETLGETYVRDPLLAKLRYTRDDKQIVSPAALFAMCSTVPLSLQLFVSCFDHPSFAKACVAARFSSLLFASGTAIAVVDVLKRYVGYWRPYVYDECDFKLASGRCGDDAPDAFRSFPSGHAAISFAALGHTSLCLLGCARLGAPFGKTIDLGNFLLLVCLGPVFLAFWIAASRVRENDHWPADVVAGGVIGAASAALFYSRYFSGVFTPDGHLPRPAFRHNKASSGGPAAALLIDGTSSSSAVAGDSQWYQRLVDARGPSSPHQQQRDSSGLSSEDGDASLSLGLRPNPQELH